MNNSRKINNVQDAIEAMVTLGTLPSQIDYTAPYKRKANEAEAFLQTLSKEERQAAYDSVEAQVNEYHSPIDGWDCSPADLDNQF